jgi:restriction system protein
MAEVTRRRTGEFLRKLFELLMPHPEGMQARDAIAALEAAVPLSDYEQGTYESGGRRFDKIVRFATVDCAKAGWLQKTKGRWIVTEEGIAAYATYPDPEAFYKRAIKLYHEWKASRLDAPDPPGAEEEGEGDTSSKIASITFEEAEEQAGREIEEYLKGIKPFDFQELVAALLRGMGYYVSWIAPPGKDGGIDILALADPLGTRPPRIKVQVKRQSASVSVEGLRSFMALLGDDDVGLFISTGGFTKDASEAARTQEKRKVTLINLEGLVDLWIQHYGKLAEDARRYLPLRPIHFLAPES